MSEEQGEVHDSLPHPPMLTLDIVNPIEDGSWVVCSSCGPLCWGERVALFLSHNR
ncbi:hypothetical protein Csa_016900, partial [Cucumis sativus]